jgi:hypothetical protein
MNLKFLAATALVIVASEASFSTVATASDTDWKLYGTTDKNGDTELCFFDIKGAVKTPDEHIKVWTKCLHQKDIDSIDIKKDFGGKIVENAARKMVNRYIPPIALVEEGVDFDQATNFSAFEEIANIANIEPSARIFYEIDCSKIMLRELSVQIVNVGGKSGSTHSVSEWHYVAPETNGARLQKLLCEKSVVR